ncbi:hypothetical protein G9A89_016178 [Geosiphon pyriformis]|nr:hypothetical protein G9A89_016178 [Geosiphon pyriformis]
MLNFIKEFNKLYATWIQIDQMTQKHEEEAKTNSTQTHQIVKNMPKIQVEPNVKTIGSKEKNKLKVILAILKIMDDYFHITATC